MCRKLAIRHCSAALLLVGCGAEPNQYDDTSFSTASVTTESTLSFSRTNRHVPSGWSEQQWTTLLSLSPLRPLPCDTTNAVADSQQAQRLGKKFFFDPAFSGPLGVASDLGNVGDSGKVSCASCHSGRYFDDRRSQPGNVSVGTGFHSRNAPPLANSAYQRWTNWGGRFSAAWELPLVVVESPIIMNGNRLAVAHHVFDNYRNDYERVFGPMNPAIGSDAARFPAAGKPKPAPSTTNPNPADGAWEAMTPEDRDVINRILVNFSKSLAAYIRTLTSQHSPFDQYVARNRWAMSPAALRGAQLFVGKANCVQCHSGPNFSDGEFHNLGVPQVGEHVPASDDGRFKDVPPLLASQLSAAGPYSDDVAEGQQRLEGLTNPMPESTRGAFRTPSLRGIAETAPYMHSGQFATLEEVVDFYDDGGGSPVSGAKDPRMVPLALTDDEQSDLVAFLRSLSGTPVR